MKKYLLICLICSTSITAFCQSERLPGIEDLKKELQGLKGIKYVDKANEISETYGNSGFPKFLQRADSITRYGTLALNEAKKIAYKKGIAEAYLSLAIGQKIRGTGLHINNQDITPALESMLNYAIQAAELGDEIKDVLLTGSSCLLIGSVNWAEANISSDKIKSLSTKYRCTDLDLLFQKAGDEKTEGEICTWSAEGFTMNGNYEQAFDFSQRAIRLNQKVIPLSKTKEDYAYRVYLYQQSLSDLSNLYKEAGDYHSALEYLNKAEQAGITYNRKWAPEKEKAAIFQLLGQNDSAFFYLNKNRAASPDNSWTQLSLGQNFLAINEPDSALFFLQKALAGLKKINNSYLVAPAILYISSAYEKKKDFKTALTYAAPVMAEAAGLTEKPRPLMMEGYELLSKIYYGLGKSDSAYLYLLKHNALKDSIKNKQFLFRIHTAKKEATIGFLNRDNKIKEQQLKQEAQLKYSLIIGLLGLFITGFFIFRWLTQKRKNERLSSEKVKAELQRKASDLEMQALRAQMNPHFIFNCLSSINKFILKNEPDAASDYLTRFSRLIRMVLINSQKPLITLEDELDMLTIYLDMERLRFKNTFDYNIIFSNRVDTGNLYIPSLLLQPFCENAIWHGLRHLADPQSGRHEQGRLDIILSMDNKVLNCSITDNGIGRQKAAEIRSKSAEDKKSMGLKITTERLALLNMENNINSFYKIEDVLNEQNEVAGTKVNLRIRYKETVEESV